MADTSPTPAREPISSLTILPDIIENFSAIAKDLVEYVQLRTGIDVTPQAEAIKPTPTPTPTPTPEVSVDVETEKKPKSIFAKILGGVTKIFSPKVIIGALAAAGIVAVLASDMFEGFRESFSEFTSNLWDKMKEGFAGIGEWFSNLFSKGGELISNLYDGVAEFIQPFKDRVVEFFTSIGDYISEKFASVTAFFGTFKIFGKKEKPVEIKKEPTEQEIKDSQPTITKGVDEDGFEYTERKAAKKVIKTEEQLEYEKKRDADLEERNKKSRERLKKSLEKKKQREEAEKQKQVEAVSETVTPEPQPKAEAPTTKPKVQKLPSKPTKKVSGMEDTKAMIIKHEGVRNEPYKDSLGLWTVGVGHLIGDGKTLPPEMNRRFSDKEVMDMFEEDFTHHKKIAEDTPGYQAANEGGKAAFIDLSFNMGKWWPKWPTTKKLLANEQFEDAAEAMKDSKWYTQVGNRAVTITNLVAQAGDGKGEAIATGSNEVAITKRSMSKPQTPVVVNAPTTNNTTLVNNDVTPMKQDKTGTSNSLLARSV